ncbi:MAG: hypothetical protein R3F50_09190 [Gammaproteobacteria bacterium]|jgi:rubrerythrin
MNILRSDSEANIHQLSASLIDARNLYEMVAEFPELETVRETIDDIVSERSRHIKGLKQCLLDMGQLPSDGNDDSATALGFGARLETAISEDPLKSTVARCIATENGLLELARNSLEDLDETGIREELKDIENHVKKTLDRLNRLAERNSGQDTD